MTSDLVLLSPLDGWASSLAEVPDAVFAEAMLGDGIAIDPECAAWIGWLHGPASLRYGGDALTGVLRIEPRETPPTAGRFDLGGMEISGTP